MKTILSTISLIIALLTVSACDKDKDDTTTLCDETVIISADDYHNAPDDHLNIISAEIKGDCLTIEFGSSGCSGKTWEVKLIDAGTVDKSLPPQRNIRLSLLNNEDCAAYFNREVSYDISQLQVYGGKVQLNIKGWDGQVLYEY